MAATFRVTQGEDLAAAAPKLGPTELASSLGPEALGQAIFEVFLEP